jgi:hypothetical protein
VRLTGDWEAWLDFFAEAVIVTATQAVEAAQQLGIVKELTSWKRNRLFSYAGYIEIMSRGTELPGR